VKHSGLHSAFDSARIAAFRLAFTGERSPDVFETTRDQSLVPRVRRRAPNTTDRECLRAIGMVRQLIEHVYRVGNAYRDRHYGERNAEARACALRDLAVACPGFTDTEYLEAFDAGLLWTCF
jgi:hypothetical protein